MTLILKVFLALATSISGHINDRDGHAIAGATVTLVEAKRSVRTDKDGAFAFADIPAGTYTVVARHLGYSPAAQRVDISDGSQPLTLTLQPAALRAEPITVTATRGAGATLL